MVPYTIYKSSSACDTRVTTDGKTNSRPSVELLGKMSAQKDADRYNMKHRYRGKCVIFNHEYFTDYARREGTALDAQRLKETFDRLNFSVEICNDYEYSSVMKKINELSEEDHSDNDCICIFVLTHGLQDDNLCAKDVVYKADRIWEPFVPDRCSTLAGKPKLFFFQACRGDNSDKGTTLRSGRTETDSSITSYRIPIHADFLFAHSTVKGFFSWRNPKEGTWYVQSLCNIIDKHAETTDLLRMLTMTARVVATNYASINDDDPSMHDQKQVPSINSTLIRDVYFAPKND